MDLLLWITAAAAAAWLFLTFGHAWFWRTDVRLGPADEAGPAPSVAVVVPARDEAGVLGRTLPTLTAQRYAGDLRIILVDDGSTDDTAAIARALPGVEVTAPPPLPPGWTGKLWAVRHGVELAGDVDYLLLTDADIAHAPDSLARLTAEARRDNLDLVSVMARLNVTSRWERLIVPAFVYFFGKLFPFRRVNRNPGRTAAAAGGCVLLKREALDKAGGIEAIRGAVIDDVTLGTAVKRSGGRIRLVLADPVDQVDSVRPYPQLVDLWRMVARSAFAQLHHSWLLLAGTVFGLALVYLVPPLFTVVGLVTGDFSTAAVALLTWALMTATYLPMVRYYGLPPVYALTLPLAATLYLGMTVDSAVQHARGRGAAWKGRTYGAPDGHSAETSGP